jgi:hypothetical protein
MPASKHEILKTLQKKIEDQSLDEIIVQLQNRLGLIFILKKPENQNLCLKDTDVVRDEYKSIIDLEDLTNYLFAKEISLQELQSNNLPLPDDPNEFWCLVRKK